MLWVASTMDMKDTIEASCVQNSPARIEALQYIRYHGSSFERSSASTKLLIMNQ